MTMAMQPSTNLAPLSVGSPHTHVSEISKLSECSEVSQLSALSQLSSPSVAPRPHALSHPPGSRIPPFSGNGDDANNSPYAEGANMHTVPHYPGAGIHTDMPYAGGSGGYYDPSTPPRGMPTGPDGPVGGDACGSGGVGGSGGEDLSRSRDGSVGYTEVPYVDTAYSPDKSPQSPQRQRHPVRGDAVAALQEGPMQSPPCEGTINEQGGTGVVPQTAPPTYYPEDDLDF